MNETFDLDTLDIDALDVEELEPRLEFADCGCGLTYLDQGGPGVHISASFYDCGCLG